MSKRPCDGIVAISASLVLAAGAWAADPGTTAFDRMIGHYETIRLQLLSDSSKGVADHATDISDIALGLTERFDPGAAAVEPSRQADCVGLLVDIRTTARRLSEATQLDAMREAFGTLSAVMVRYHEMTGRSGSVVVFCPMVNQVWLQPKGKIGNPYYGASMAGCGEIVSQ